MRRRTQVALAGMAAGATFFTVGTTSAAFTDSASSPAQVSAGSLDLSVAPAGQGGLALVSGAPAVSPVHVTSSVGGPAFLTVSLVGPPGSGPCAGLPPALLTVRAAAGAPVSGTLCDLLTQPVRVLALDSAGPAELMFRLDAATAATPGTWTGLLRLTLSQTGGGFSDTEDVPLSITMPAAGSHGNAGSNGNAGSYGNTGSHGNTGSNGNGRNGRP